MGSSGYENPWLAMCLAAHSLAIDNRDPKLHRLGYRTHVRFPRSRHKNAQMICLRKTTFGLSIAFLLATQAIAQTTARVDSESKAENTFQKTSFPSEDGLEITGDMYQANDDKTTPFIVLCHQAGWSRGEYREIAPKLMDLGFNCLAIDQRSGGGVNGVANETAKRAKAEKKGTEFADAEQDIVAALKWARANHAEGKILLWGSSYSSALALRISGERPELVDGVLAFAPGEYFVRFSKPKDWITTSAKKIQVPAFITSAKDEFPRWEGIYKAIPGESKTKFVPTTKGNHGSRALWAKFDDSTEYWKSVKAFLSQFTS